MQIQPIWGPYQPIFPQFRHSAPLFFANPGSGPEWCVETTDLELTSRTLTPFFFLAWGLIGGCLVFTCDQNNFNLPGMCIPCYCTYILYKNHGLVLFAFVSVWSAKSQILQIRSPWLTAKWGFGSPSFKSVVKPVQYQQLF